MYLLLSILALVSYIYSKADRSNFVMYPLLIIATILVGIRSVDVGRDTLYYHQLFNDAIYGGWHQVNEPGYTMLIKLVHKIGGSVQLMFISIAAFTVFCFNWYIKKFSSDYHLSLLVFFFMGSFYLMLFNQVRQFAAMSLLVASLDLFAKRKYIHLLPLIGFAAFFFHLSILFTIPALVLFRGYISNSKKIIGIISIFLFIKAIVLLSHYTPYSYFFTKRTDLSMNYSLVYLQLTLYIILLFFEKPIIDKRPELQIIYNMGYFSSVLLVIMVLNPQLPFEPFLRIQNYYLPFLIILLPESIRYASKNMNIRFIIETSLVIFLFLYFLRNTQVKGEFYSLQPYSFNLNFFL